MERPRIHPRINMKHPLKTIVPLLAVAALTAACNPFANDYSHVSGLQDPRFAPFTYTSDRKTKVQTRLDSFNERWPGNASNQRQRGYRSHPFGNPPRPRAGSRILVDRSRHRPHHDDRHPHGRVYRGTRAFCPESIRGSTSSCQRTATSRRSTPTTPTPFSHPKKAREIRVSEPCPSAL